MSETRYEANRKRRQQRKAHKFANQLTNELFTNGAGKAASRLVLTSSEGRDLGEWGLRVIQRKLYQSALALIAKESTHV